MATEALSGSSAPVEGLSYRNLTGKNVKLIINYMEIYLRPNQNPGRYVDVTFSWGGGGGSQFKIPDDNLRFGDSPYLTFAFGKSLAYFSTQLTARTTNSGSGSFFSSVTSVIPSTSSKNLIGYYPPSLTGAFSVPKDPLAVPMEYIIAPDKRFSITGTQVGSTGLPTLPFIGPYNIVIITED